MRGLRTRIAVLAVGSLVTGTPAAYAGPWADGPDGPRCSLAAARNPNAEPNTQTGTISGEVYAESDSHIPQSGTLHCTVQVGAHSTHAASSFSSPRGNDADGGHVSAHGTGSVTIPPTAVSYTARPDSDIWLCSEFVYDGGPTVYWHADNDDDPTTDTGHWTLDRTSECDLGIQAQTPDNEVIVLVNGLICPTLKTILPPDGDVAGAWDCPPYDN